MYLVDLPPDQEDDSHQVEQDEGGYEDCGLCPVVPVLPFLLPCHLVQGQGGGGAEDGHHAVPGGARKMCTLIWTV